MSQGEELHPASEGSVIGAPAAEPMPSAYARPGTPAETSSDFGRTFAKWAVGLAFFLSMLALLTVLPLYQVTAEGPAKQTLRRATAALTEIDPLIDRNFDDLQQRAAAIGPGETVQLKDYPIAIALTREQALGLSKEQLRDLLLDRSADALYQDGTSPLRDSTGGRGHVGRFTIGGITDRGLGALRSRYHDIFGVLLFVLAALSAVLGVTLAFLCRGFGRLASVGAVVMLASVPLLAAGIGGRFYMRIAAENETEYIESEFLSIGKALAWIPIRDGLAIFTLGAVFLIVGLVCAWWTDRQARQRPAQHGYGA